MCMYERRCTCSSQSSSVLECILGQLVGSGIHMSEHNFRLGGVQGLLLSVGVQPYVCLYACKWDMHEGTRAWALFYEKCHYFTNPRGLV